MRKNNSIKLAATIMLTVLTFLGCKKTVSEKDTFLEDAVTFAEEQTNLMLA